MNSQKCKPSCAGETEKKKGENAARWGSDADEGCFFDDDGGSDNDVGCFADDERGSDAGEGCFADDDEVPLVIEGASSRVGEEVMISLAEMMKNRDTRNAESLHRLFQDVLDNLSYMILSNCKVHMGPVHGQSCQRRGLVHSHSCGRRDLFHGQIYGPGCGRPVQFKGARPEPTVLQQSNGYDCGAFVLLFVEYFIKHAPERLKMEHLTMVPVDCCLPL
ncbi:hypothetical protein L1987_45982 [Smallanthus sonchifolius]|uniref:Uncharacterized protein n=1 Tax=Smallanthus sonchifolius TaxID=185202 RepID=A0ACB9FZI4_9ASTR|nr:hypothetical protein L1987_45982 [Smallanthus sonchifolius]